MSDAERRILTILDGFIETKVLMTAYQLDVFTLLAKEALTRDEALARLSLPRRSGTILLNACVALGLIEDSGGALRTAPDAAPFLVRGPEQPFRATSYLIDYYNEVYRALCDMNEIVRTDGAISTFKLRDYFKDDVAAVDPLVAAEYTRYMDATIQSIVDVVSTAFSFADKEFLFDLCGGAGSFAIGIAKLHPHLRVGFLDVPACVAIGEARLLGDPDLGARAMALAGDLFKTPLPTGPDVYTMCRAAMDWGDDKILGVYRKVHDALPPGGSFLVVERMLPETFDPAARSNYLRSVYFLAKSTTTELRAPERHMAMMRAAGFASAREIAPSRDPHEYLRGFRIVLGEKR